MQRTQNVKSGAFLNYMPDVGFFVAPAPVEGCFCSSALGLVDEAMQGRAGACPAADVATELNDCQAVTHLIHVHGDMVDGMIEDAVNAIHLNS